MAKGGVRFGAAVLALCAVAIGSALVMAQAASSRAAYEADQGAAFDERYADRMERCRQPAAKAAKRARRAARQLKRAERQARKAEKRYRQSKTNGAARKLTQAKRKLKQARKQSRKARKRVKRARENRRRCIAQLKRTLVTVEAGAAHSCGIRASGQAVCWGRNADGQLGDGTSEDRLTPVPVQDLTDAVAITVGTYHSCAIRESGQAVCWGSNRYGRLGDGTTEPRSAPVPVEGLDDAVAISAGEWHTCAIRESGHAVCWGQNLYGQLGDGTNEEERHTPHPVKDLEAVAAISSGTIHTCAIGGESGRLWCWGANGNRQLGDGTNEQRNQPTEVIAGVRDVAAGAVRTCAIRTSGEALCWGNNEAGRLGTGHEDRHIPTPTPVVGLADAAMITVRGSHACAIRTSGQAVCWGWNASGQLGDGTQEDRTGPTPVHGLDDAALVSAGSSHTCAISARTLRTLCWGSNASGRLGDGSGEDHLTPTPIRH